MNSLLPIQWSSEWLSGLHKTNLFFMADYGSNEPPDSQPHAPLCEGKAEDLTVPVVSNRIWNNSLFYKEFFISSCSVPLYNCSFSLKKHLTWCSTFFLFTPERKGVVSHTESNKFRSRQYRLPQHSLLNEQNSKLLKSCIYCQKF